MFLVFNEEDNDLLLRKDETRRVSTFPEFHCLEFGEVLLKWDIWTWYCNKKSQVVRPRLTFHLWKLTTYTISLKQVISPSLNSLIFLEVIITFLHLDVVTVLCSLYNEGWLSSAMSLQVNHFRDTCPPQMGAWWHHRHKGKSGLETRKARARKEPVCKFPDCRTHPRQP